VESVLKKKRKATDLRFERFAENEGFKPGNERVRGDEIIIIIISVNVSSITTVYNSIVIAMRCCVAV